MKILLKGYYGFGNFGDDLLLLVIYRMTKEYFPDAKIEVFSNATRNNANFHADSDYHLYIKKHLDEPDIKIVDWTHRSYYDIVIDGGGGVYFDYTKARSFKKFVHKVVSLFSPQHFFAFEQRVRRMIGRPSRLTFDRRYAIGTNIGPFGTESARFLSLYALLGAVDAFLVRDSESMRYLERFGHRGERSQIADVVFTPGYMPEFEAFQAKERKELKTIGIVVMDWKQQGRQYLDTLKCFAGDAKVQGYACRFFAFSQLDDSALQEGFEYTINYWKPGEMSVGEYLEKLAQTDLVVSMRFHGLVVATALGIPSVGIGINSKIVDFTQQAQGCSRLVSSEGIAKELPLVVEEISEKYDEMVENAKASREAFGKSETMMRDFMQRVVKREG